MCESRRHMIVIHHQPSNPTYCRIIKWRLLDATNGPDNCSYRGKVAWHKYKHLQSSQYQYLYAINLTQQVMYLLNIHPPGRMTASDWNLSLMLCWCQPGKRLILSYYQSTTLDPSASWSTISIKSVATSRSVSYLVIHELGHKQGYKIHAPWYPVPWQKLPVCNFPSTFTRSPSWTLNKLQSRFHRLLPINQTLLVEQLYMLIHSPNLPYSKRAGSPVAALLFWRSLKRGRSLWRKMEAANSSIHSTLDCTLVLYFQLSKPVLCCCCSLFPLC